MKEVRIGFVGLGTVGAGALAALTAEPETIARKAGTPLRVTRAAVRDPELPRPVDLNGVALTTDALAVATDPEIDLVVEVMGGVGLAREVVSAALRAGKSVVTANKELIAKHGRELFALADQHGADLAFEGSVGGGIPIIAPLGHGLTANRVHQVVGIINGTTNYILSAMTRSGQPFDQLLAEAQAKGYAEADPTDDVEGHDAAYKLTILAMLAFNTAVAEEQVYREGISSLQPEDIALAHQLGYVFKLLAVAKDRGDRLELRVSPCLVPEKHPLASVNDVYNAIFIEAEPVGQVMFYGRGYPLAFDDQRPVATLDQIESSYYVRMRIVDRAGVLATLAGVLGDHGVSIAQVLQTAHNDCDCGCDCAGAELVWITHHTTEASIRDSLSVMRGLDVVNCICNVYRCFGVDGD